MVVCARVHACVRACVGTARTDFHKQAGASTNRSYVTGSHTTPRELRWGGLAASSLVPPTPPRAARAALAGPRSPAQLTSFCPAPLGHLGKRLATQEHTGTHHHTNTNTNTNTHTHTPEISTHTHTHTHTHTKTPKISARARTHTHTHTPEIAIGIAAGAHRQLPHYNLLLCE